MQNETVDRSAADQFRVIGRTLRSRRGVALARRRNVVPTANARRSPASPLVKQGAADLLLAEIYDFISALGA